MEGNRSVRPFPGNLQHTDFDTMHKVTTLVGLGNNNDAEKKRNQCLDTVWSPDGQFFAWSCGQMKLKILPVERITSKKLNDEECVPMECRQLVTALEFINVDRCRHCSRLSSPNSDYHMVRWEEHSQVLAVGLRNGRIRIIDINTGSILLVLVDHTDHVSQLQFVPNQNLTLISASYDGTIKFWELADDGNMAASIKPTDYLGIRGGDHKVMCIAASPDTQRAVAVGTFKTVVMFDMTAYSVLHRLTGHANHVNSCQFSPDGVLLVTASVDTTALVWNSYTGVPYCKLGHQFPPPLEWFPGDNDTNVLHCRFTNDGLGVVTVADDGFVRLWDLHNPSSPSALCAVDEPIGCSFNSSGDLLAIVTTGGNVEMVRCPHKMLSLAQICRTIINNSAYTDYSSIDKLLIPTTLKGFLRYENVDL